MWHSGAVDMHGRLSDGGKSWSESLMRLFDRKLRHAEQTLMTRMDTSTSMSAPPQRSDDNTRMRGLTHYIVFVIAVQTLCCADVTTFAAANPPGGRLAPGDRKLLQDSSRFHEVHSTGNLPPAVVALCGDKVAEPGGNWNATDAISDPTLPSRRLIWAAIGDQYFVVHYERGGIAHTFHILVAKLAKNDAQPKVVWSAIGGPFKDYAAFVDALRTGKLDDRLDWH